MLDAIRNRLQSELDILTQHRGRLSELVQQSQNIQMQIRQLELSCVQVDGRVSALTQILEEQGSGSDVVVSKGPVTLPKVRESAEPAHPQNDSKAMSHEEILAEAKKQGVVSSGSSTISAGNAGPQNKSKSVEEFMREDSGEDVVEAQHSTTKEGMPGMRDPRSNPVLIDPPPED